MLREWRLHALSVFSLAVAFVCLGASLLVVTNLRAIEERWAHAGRASIYLKDNAQAQDVESLKQWRLSHVGDDSNSDGRLAALDRQMQQIQAEQANLIRDLVGNQRARRP